jgi:hypothetical protein
MYEYLSKNGELYFIEVLEDGEFIPVGDVPLKEENPSIAIGVPQYRGMGIGKKVMTAIIARARELGIARFYGTKIYDYNIASQKLFESLVSVREEWRKPRIPTGTRPSPITGRKGISPHGGRSPARDVVSYVSEVGCQPVPAVAATNSFPSCDTAPSNAALAIWFVESAACIIFTTPASKDQI